MKKLFIQTAFLLVCFLFSLAFFSRPVNACAPGQSCGACGGNACSSASPNYTGNCRNLGNTYDCSPCYSCDPAVAPPPAAPPPAAPVAPSGACSHNLTDAEAQCYLNRYPDLQAAFGANNIAAAKQHWLTYGCKEGRDYSCGPSCGGIGGTDCTKAADRLQTGHWYCHSLGNTYDCTGNGGCMKCSHGTDVCPGPPPLSPCSCSTSYGACNVGCPVGQKQKIVSCNRSGCGESTWCVADSACCVCGGWVNGACGATVGCSDGQRRQTRTCNPSGCASTSQCVNDSACVRAWFQSQGGDIHAQGNLSDKIPSTATDRNLSVTPLGGYPGIVSHQSFPDAFFGEGYPSNNQDYHWLAESKYEGKPYGSFDFFKKKYAMEMIEENFDGSLPQADGVYYSKSSKTLSGNWTVPASRWLVILVEGEVTIPQDIKVNKGGFLAIASSGKITFAGSVTQAQGMFVAETIETGTSATAFAGEGIFAATTFSLGRDFGDARNQTTPAETFVARPDFIMSSYKNKDENLWWFFQKWQELAP